jgi:hypothetical protein
VAPLPVIADTYRCAITWVNSFYSRSAVNVMHFYAPASSAAAVWTALDAHVTANMWGAATVDMQATQVQITPLDGSTNTVIETPAAVAKWQGAQSTGDIVPQVAVIVKSVTSIRGRSHRGRIFLPYPAELKISLGLVDATVQSNTTSAWASFLTAMSAAAVHPTVASYKLASQSQITGYTCERMLATIRRRQIRR